MSLGPGNQEMTLKRQKGRGGRFKERPPLFHQGVMHSGRQIGGRRKGRKVQNRLYVEAVPRGSVGEQAKAGENERCLGRDAGVCMKTTAGGSGCLGCFFGEQYFSNICGHTAFQRQKLQGYINSGTVRVASAPNSFCVKTCQLCKKISNKRYS